MKIIDYFFYIIYRGLRKLIKTKTPDDLKWSAFLYTCLYFTLFIFNIICAVALSNPNPFCCYIVNNYIIGMLAIQIFSLFLGIRYYRYITIQQIEERFLLISQCKQNCIRYLVYTLMVLIPICFWIVYRFYLFGHI
jgi:hypothetical protein